MALRKDGRKLKKRKTVKCYSEKAAPSVDLMFPSTYVSQERPRPDANIYFKNYSDKILTEYFCCS